MTDLPLRNFEVRPFNIDHAMTAVKYVKRLNEAGQSALTLILLTDGFDAAWFNNGQRSLPIPP